jgi:hypothetical protein
VQGGERRRLDDTLASSTLGRANPLATTATVFTVTSFASFAGFASILAVLAVLLAVLLARILPHSQYRRRAHASQGFSKNPLLLLRRSQLLQ